MNFLKSVFRVAGAAKSRTAETKTLKDLFDRVIVISLPTSTNRRAYIADHF